MGIVVVSIAVIAIIMVIMSVGVMFGNRPLRGSCGGTAVIGPDGELLTCGDCHCKLPEADDHGSTQS